MDSHVFVGQGNALHLPLPSDSVNVIATSVPYYKMRQYDGVQELSWPAVIYRPMSDVEPVQVEPWRGSLGQEPTLQMYVAHIVLLWREMWRVLHPTGICWLNLGDTFASKKQNGLRRKNLLLVPHRVALALQADGWYLRAAPEWVKIGSSPESVSDRPSISHESIFLLTKSENYFFDHRAVQKPLAESSRIRLQQSTFWQQTGGAKDYGASNTNLNRSARRTLNNLRRGATSGRNWRTSDVWFDSAAHVIDGMRDWIKKTEQALQDAKVWLRAHEGIVQNEGMWFDIDEHTPLAIQTSLSHYSGNHFAVWPLALAKEMIKAGISEYGVCAKCGTPWERVVEQALLPDTTRPQAARAIRLYQASDLTEEHIRAIRAVGISDAGKNKLTQGDKGNSAKVKRLAAEAKAVLGGYFREFLFTPHETTGWRATCTCGTDQVRPSVALDPFVGSGTTVMAAYQLGAVAIGLDLSRAYIKEAYQRTGLEEWRRFMGKGEESTGLYKPEEGESIEHLPLFSRLS